MVDIKAIVDLQIMLFLLMGIGYASAKGGVITEETKKHVSDLLVYIILPCNILASFNQEMPPEVIRNSAEVIIISVGIQLLSIALAYLLYRKAPPDKINVLKHGTLSSNASFIGIPVIGGIYGPEGVIYTSLAVIPMRIFMWSIGLSFYTSSNKKNMIRTIVTHPCILSAILGFLMMVFNLHFPSVISNTLSSVSACCTAISMMIIGAILSEVDIKSVFDKDALWYSFVRLLLLPVIVLFVLKFLGISGAVYGVSVLLTAMPMGSTTVILAEKYNANGPFASKCIFMTALLSIITLPILGLLL
ncbi:MAG: AEC family transporter [Lachnospiraceae bacterium]|nr:AEC family transporter [Lachnospiraceae bacterium]